MGVCYVVAEKTTRFFMLKVREAMGSSGNDPMDVDVHVDEFALGGSEDKGKTGRSYITRQVILLFNIF